MKGRRSTPGRYFQVADPGTGWGGTNISDPLSVLGPFNPKEARPGLTMLMVSTTGEHAAYYVLDEALRPVETEMPPELRFSVERIQENCEPALCTVLFMGGAGGSLRAGVTDNPVRLTRSVKDALTRVTSGGAPVYVWPGGGITFMVDVTLMPAGAFGYVPTPALVAPIEFTLRLADYAALGGHMDYVRPLASLKDHAEVRPMPCDAGAARMKRLPQISASRRRQAAAFAGRPDRSHRRSEGDARRTCAPPMTRRRNASAACSMSSARNWRCCARPPTRAIPLEGRRRAADACGGRAVCRRWLHHADGGGGRQRRGGNPRRDAALPRRSSAPMSTMAATSRCISLRMRQFTVGLMDRPDRPGVMRTMTVRCR